MSTHQLKEALVLATHVALIRRGEIAFSGDRTQQMVTIRDGCTAPMRTLRPSPNRS